MDGGFKIDDIELNRPADFALSGDRSALREFSEMEKLRLRRWSDDTGPVDLGTWCG